MGLTLYELTGKDDCRFSPFCWCVLLALAHKGLDAERVPVRFTEKEKIAFSGQGLVPVLVDGERWVADSWDIGGYLDERYPERPLMTGALGPAGTRFVHDWKGVAIGAAIFPMIAGDLFGHVHEADLAYFRETREKRLGTSLADAQAGRDGRRPGFRNGLAPMRELLVDQPFLSGDEPAFADYTVFGPFQWARMVSPYPLLEAEDPVFAWRDRMLNLFGGLAAKAPGYPVI